MLKFIILLWIYLNQEYEYILKEQINIPVNQPFFYNVNKYNITSYKLTFKIKFENAGDEMDFHNGKHSNNIRNQLNENYYLGVLLVNNNSTYNHYMPWNKMNKNYSINSNGRIDHSIFHPVNNENEHWKLIKIEPKINSAILDPIIINYNLDDIGDKKYLINESDYYDYYPLTLSLIDFYNNPPQSKFLYNEVKNLYTWNVNDIPEYTDRRYGNYNLFSEYNSDNIPEWYYINNIGSIKINDLLVNYLNKMLWKNVSIGLNVEIIFNIIRLTYNRFFLIKLKDNSTINFALNIYQNNSEIRFLIRIYPKTSYKTIYYLHCTAKYINHLVFNNMIFNIRENKMEKKIYIFPIIKLNRKYSNAIYIRDGIGNYYFDGILDISKIYLGGNHYPYWSLSRKILKVIYNEFHILKGNFKYINNSHHANFKLKSIDTNNKIIYNFNSNVYKLVRPNNLNNDYDCKSNDDCNKFYIYKKDSIDNFKNNNCLINYGNSDCGYTKLNNSNNSSNPIGHLNYRNTLESGGYFEMIIVYTIIKDQFIWIKDEVNKYFALKSNNYKNYLSIKAKILDWIVIFFLGGVLNSDKIFFEIFIKKININFINNNYNCDSGMKMDILLGSWYGKCHNNSTVLPNKYYDTNLNVYSYCKNNCKVCSVVNNNIKSNEMHSYNNFPQITKFIDNNNYQSTFIKNNKLYFTLGTPTTDNSIFLKNDNVNTIANINFKFKNCTFLNIKNFNCDTNNREDGRYCILGYYKRNGMCTDCGTEFKLYEFNNRKYLINFHICKNCDINFYYNFTTSECIANTDNCKIQRLKDLCINIVLKNYYFNNTDIKLRSSLICNNSECSECNLGFYLENGVCISCNITNCEKCIKYKNYYLNENVIKCLKCNTRYYLDMINNSCLNKYNGTNCVVGFYNSSGNCIKCIKNCKSCSDINCSECKTNYVYNSDWNECKLKEGCVDETCENCISGYYKSNNVCHRCFDNCLICRDGNSCLKCREFFKNNEVSCDKFVGCKYIQCYQCKDGFSYLREGICNKCINNCLYCHKNLYCLKCELFYNNINGKCIKIIKKPEPEIEEGYIKINGKLINKNNIYEKNVVTNNYLNCIDNYLQINVNNLKICINSDNRIRKYTNFFHFSILYNNYYILDDRNLIKNIIYRKNIDDNCIIGLDDISCSKCKKKYLLNNDSNCNKTSALRCKKYYNFEVCESCYSNYFINQYNNCQHLNTNYKCSNIKKGLCLNCNMGYYKYGSFCKSCNTELKYCLKCKNGNNCLQCDSNNKDIYLSNYGLCKKCHFPCKLVSNLKILRCFKGYYLKDNKCHICKILFCENCYEDNCFKCSIGFYIKNNMCFKCDNNCINCNKNQCLNSKIGYYLNNYYVKKCPQDCLICDDIDICLKCDISQGYYLDFKTQKCILKNLNCSKFNDKNFCVRCKIGYFFPNKSYICTPCNKSCITCKYFNNNCIKCKKGYSLLKEIINNNIISKCYKKCLKTKIFDLENKICLNCGIYYWEILNKYNLKLYYYKKLKLKNIKYIKSLISIKFIDDKPLKFAIISIEENYININLNFKYTSRITYFNLDIKQGLFINNNCTESVYNKIIRGIDFNFEKNKIKNNKIELWSKNTNEYKYINKYGKILEKTAFITSIILLSISIFDLRLSNLVSKLFNNFQIISFIFNINFKYSRTWNTIIDIVNLNLSITIDEYYFDYSYSEQSIFSQKIYQENEKIKYINQRFFTQLDINILLILIGFLIRYLLKLFKKYYNYFFKAKFKFLPSNNEESENIINAERTINITKEKNIKFKKEKLDNYEKIDYNIKVFQLTMIMGESTNIFLFLCNFYKTFNLIDFKNKYHYIIIFYWIIYNIFILYFIVQTLNIIKKIKKYSIHKIYRKKLNYFCQYFLVIGDFKYNSIHFYFWIIELFRNFLIAFNLIYMNNHIEIQILSVLLVQLIYVIIIFFFNKIYNFETIKLKIQEISLFYIFIKVYIILRLKESKNTDLVNQYNEITGLIIGLFIFNILTVINEILSNFIKFIMKKHDIFKF